MRKSALGFFLIQSVQEVFGGGFLVSYTGWWAKPQGLSWRLLLKLDFLDNLLG